MARVPGHEAVYEAAEHWVDTALREDDSLFTPGKQIWSLANLTDFHTRFTGSPDAIGKDFWTRFHLQLDGAPTATTQLAAEILYVYYLIIWPSAIRGDAKRERIGRVLARTRSQESIPEPLNSTLNDGLINPGAARSHMHASVQVIAEFCIRWKKQSKDHQAKALADPWIFKDDIDFIEFPFSSTQSNALLHLVHPRHFEPITSKGDKRDVARSFSNLLSRSSHDIDKDLLAIRNELSDTYGESFHLYDEDKRFVWDTSMSVLERFVRWGHRFVEHETFNELEIDFKLKPAGRIGDARRAFRSGESDWLSLLKKAFRQQSLVPFYTYDSFLKWCTESQPDARLALSELWSADLDIEEAIRGFSSRFPTDAVGGVGTRTRLISFLAMAINPHRYPIYGRTLYNRAYDMVEHPRPGERADEASVYTHALGFLDRTLKEASDRDLRLQDRLYAQSMIWSLFSTDEKRKKVLPEVEHHAFRQFISLNRRVVNPPKFEYSIVNKEYRQYQEINALTLPAATGEGESLSYSLSPPPPAGLTFDSNTRTLSGTPTAEQAATTYTYTATDEDGRSAKQTFSITVSAETLHDLAARLFWDADHLQDIHSLLQDKGQIVFYGPPGTGKTFVAQELAHHFARAEDRTDLVQFHPSYAYEDFVEGFRPDTIRDQPVLQTARRTPQVHRRQSPRQSRRNARSGHRRNQPRQCRPRLRPRTVLPARIPRP